MGATQWRGHQIRCDIEICAAFHGASDSSRILKLRAIVDALARTKRIVTDIDVLRANIGTSAARAPREHMRRVFLSVPRKAAEEIARAVAAWQRQGAEPIWCRKSLRP